MTQPITFSKDGNADGIYRVNSKVPAEVSGYIGRVARVDRRWVAAPIGIGINGPHLAFHTRYQAALALQGFAITGNPAYIYPASDDPRLAKYSNV